MPDEKTSKRVATLASKVLGMSDAEIQALPPSDVRSLAASCLTQAPSKPKRVWMPWLKPKPG